MSLRVAMVGLRAPWGAQGGIEQAVGCLAPRLVRLGCEVTVYCRARYNPYGNVVHRGVRLVDVETLYTKHLEAILHTAAVLPRAVRSADVIHVHATGPALLSWWARYRGSPTVVTVHALDWKREKWGPMATAALRTGAWCAGTFPHRVITVGEHLEKHYRDRGSSNATFIPNGVDPIEPVPLQEGVVDGLESNRFLLFLGRLVPEKGLRLLLRAYRRARIDLPLVLVGGDSYTRSFVNEIRDLAGPGVILAGPRYGRARDALLTHARTLVLPSVLEGFPLAPLEAMSASTPVLLSDIAPHREILNDSGAGRLLPRDLEAWTQGLMDLARLDLQERDHMGRLGRTHVSEHYSWDRVAERTLEVYRSAVGDIRGV
ncbi:MAG: glycosyltransferase family 4 protein [Myxococcota bacterium]|jgi:glycosyltransferase involved in cell wall biosynthesis|nr:glycosyltransferase family 4 protein [Myxococcota bacterium]